MATQLQAGSNTAIAAPGEEEEEAAAAGTAVAGTNFGGSRSSIYGKPVPITLMQTLFHLNMEDAAKRLQMSLSWLKKECRKLDIKVPLHIPLLLLLPFIPIIPIIPIIPFLSHS